MNKYFKVIVLIGLMYNCFCESMDQNKKKPVSLIYYPTGSEGPAGHVEIEYKGKSWGIVSEQNYGSKSLARMINKSQTTGWPFFRFTFEADKQQRKIIKQNIKKESLHCNCARASLYPLKKAGICSVPAPINFFPFLTAVYLKLGKELRLNSVKNIEFYHNPSKKKYILKVCIGPVMESSAVISMTLGVCAFLGIGI